MKQAGWSTRWIAVALYPFGVGAAAVNVFFASLIGSWIGGPVLSMGWSIAIGCALAVPATWAFARHIRGLMDTAARSGSHELPGGPGIAPTYPCEER